MTKGTEVNEVNEVNAEATDLLNLLPLYQNFYQYQGNVDSVIAHYQDEVRLWEDQRKKIIKGIGLDEYDHSGPDNDGPIKFLTSKSNLFASVDGLDRKPENFMIYKKNNFQDSETEGESSNKSQKKEYVIIYKDGDSLYTKEEAETSFKENIEPLLRLIVNAIDQNGFTIDFDGSTPDNALKVTLLQGIQNAVKTKITGLQNNLSALPFKNKKRGSTANTDKINNLIVERFEEVLTPLNINWDEKLKEHPNSEAGDSADKILIEALVDALNEALNCLHENIASEKFSQDIIAELDKSAEPQIDPNKMSKLMTKAPDIIESVITEITTLHTDLNNMLNSEKKEVIKPGINALDLVQRTQFFEKFPGKALLMKMAILESARRDCCEELKYQLPIIPTPDTIKALYKDFFPEENAKLTIAVKSFQLFQNSLKALNLTDEKTKDNTPTQPLSPAPSAPENLTQDEKDSFIKLIEISNLLWDYEKANFLDVSPETPNVIYYGSPGTGKTYTVTKGIDLRLTAELKAGESLDDVKADRTKMVQCHPGFGYEEFIEGLKPIGFTENGTLKLEPVNGTFKTLCIRARDHRDEEYFFVADEINRANLSAMFGETLSLLETDYRDFRKTKADEKEKRQLVETPMSQLIEIYFNDKIKTAKEPPTTDGQLFTEISNAVYECDLIFVDDDKPCKLSTWCRDEKNKQPKKLKEIKNVAFGIPRNIYFIGMMNDVDKSIDAFDLALRRRFKWVRKDCDYKVLSDELCKEPNLDSDSIEKYIQACKTLNNNISGGELGFGKPYEFGHAYFMKIKNYKRNGKITELGVEKLFQEHLEPVLKEYIRSFKEESEIDKHIRKIKKDFLEPFKEE